MACASLSIGLHNQCAARTGDCKMQSCRNSSFLSHSTPVTRRHTRGRASTITGAPRRPVVVTVEMRTVHAPSTLRRARNSAVIPLSERRIEMRAHMPKGHRAMSLLCMSDLNRSRPSIARSALGWRWAAPCSFPSLSRLGSPPQLRLIDCLLSRLLDRQCVEHLQHLLPRAAQILR